MATLLSMQRSLNNSSGNLNHHHNMDRVARERLDSGAASLECYERAFMNDHSEFLYDDDDDNGEGEKGGSCRREMMTSLSSFGEEEIYEPRQQRQVKRNVSFEMKQAVERLEYSPEDLELLACNSAQFEILKQSLRKKGAITNEVLKQKLPLFLKYKRDRMAAKNPQAAQRRVPRRTKSASSATAALAQMSTAERNSNLKPANRILTEEEWMADQPPPQTVIGRILRPHAKRQTPLRTYSGMSTDKLSDAERETPLRTSSTGRSIPNRTHSLSRFVRRAVSAEGDEE